MKSKKLSKLFNSFTTWKEEEIGSNFILNDLDFYLKYIKDKIIPTTEIDNQQFQSSTSYLTSTSTPAPAPAPTTPIGSQQSFMKPQLNQQSFMKPSSSFFVDVDNQKSFMNAKPQLQSQNSFLNMTQSFVMTPQSFNQSSSNQMISNQRNNINYSLGQRMNILNVTAFISNNAKYEFLKKLYLEPFFNIKDSTDSNLLDFSDQTNTTGSNDVGDDSNQLSQQIFSCIQNYSILINNIIKENSNLIDILKGLYINKPGSQMMKVQTTYGIIEVKVPNSIPTLSNPNYM